MIQPTRRRKVESPKDILKRELSFLIQDYVSDLNSLNDFPTKWEKHGDLILLPASCLQNPIWSKLEDKLWTTIATVLKAERIARKYKVKNDDYRSPNVELLLGSDGWVIHTDNKIKYAYDITKCMFSCGNISEKLRIAKFSCKGETVVDLYAGIGYFTLPFLIHAKAALVHACEWNPHAVEALEKNLVLNNVKDKCIIHVGDNRKVCPKRVADRVNLGLIPSSEGGWETACQALKPSGGVLHIHGNVTSNLPSNNTFTDNSTTGPLCPEWKIWAQKTSSTIKDILQSLYRSDWSVTVLEIVRIKPYAPHIDHLVLDIECKPVLSDAK